MFEGPFLWYLNRGSGAVTLVLLSLTLALGLLSPGGRPARGVPRFVTQALHRHLALLAFVLLGAHIVSAVVDEYVDIAWWQAFVPVGATYEPFWLGLGAVAVDLLLVVAVTSALRQRIGPRTWRLLHRLAWPMWALALSHGVGMGTDLREGWWLVTVSSAAIVAGALLRRLYRLLGHDDPADQSPTTPLELKVLR
jgi:methionine sulfoxide reductase heme-binding subunit